MPKTTMPDASADWTDAAFDYGLDLPSSHTESDVNYSISMSTTVPPTEFSDIFPVTVAGVAVSARRSSLLRQRTPGSAATAKAVVSNQSSANSGVSAGPTSMASSYSAETADTRPYVSESASSAIRVTPHRQTRPLVRPRATATAPTTPSVDTKAEGTHRQRRPPPPTSQITVAHDDASPWEPVSLTRGPASFSVRTRRGPRGEVHSPRHSRSPSGQGRGGSIGSATAEPALSSPVGPGPQLTSPTYSLASSLVYQPTSDTFKPWDDSHRPSPATIGSSEGTNVTLRSPTSLGQGKSSTSSTPGSPIFTVATAATARMPTPVRTRSAASGTATPHSRTSSSSRHASRLENSEAVRTAQHSNHPARATPALVNASTPSASAPLLSSGRRRTYPQDAPEGAEPASQQIKVQEPKTPSSRHSIDKLLAPTVRTGSASLKRGGATAKQLVLPPITAKAGGLATAGGSKTDFSRVPTMSSAPASQAQRSLPGNKASRESPPALSPLDLANAAIPATPTPSFAPVSILKKASTDFAASTTNSVNAARALPGGEVSSSFPDPERRRRKSREATRDHAGTTSERSPRLTAQRRPEAPVAALPRPSSSASGGSFGSAEAQRHVLAEVAAKIEQHIRESAEHDRTGDDSEDMHDAVVSAPRASQKGGGATPLLSSVELRERGTKRHSASTPADNTGRTSAGAVSSQESRYVITPGSIPSVAEMVARLNSGISNNSSNATTSPVPSRRNPPSSAGTSAASSPSLAPARHAARAMQGQSRESATTGSSGGADVVSTSSSSKANSFAEKTPLSRLPNFRIAVGRTSSNDNN